MFCLAVKKRFFAGAQNDRVYKPHSLAAFMIHNLLYLLAVHNSHRRSRISIVSKSALFCKELILKHKIQV